MQLKTGIIKEPVKHKYIIDSIKSIRETTPSLKYKAAICRIIFYGKFLIGGLPYVFS